MKPEVRILLVEDNAEDVLFFKRALKQTRLACVLETAEDGQRAVEKLEESDSFHVLLDLKLPRKSGLEVLEWIRHHPGLKGLPVIILTSSELRNDYNRAQELGVDAFFVKPVSVKGLTDVVRAIAERWKIPTQPE